MELILVAGGLIAGVAGAYLGFGWLLTRSRRACPACLAKRLATTGGAFVDSATAGWLESHYTCEACGAEFREVNNNGLVPLDAWERGARVPPPVAIIRE